MNIKEVIDVDFSNTHQDYLMAEPNFKLNMGSGCGVVNFKTIIPQVEINLAHKISQPAKLLEMDQILDNLSLQFVFDKKPSSSPSGTREWLENDGLIRPLTWPKFSEMMSEIEESDEEGSIDFEREETDL